MGFSLYIEFYTHFYPKSHRVDSECWELMAAFHLCTSLAPHQCSGCKSHPAWCWVEDFSSFSTALLEANISSKASK